MGQDQSNLSDDLFPKVSMCLCGNTFTNFSWVCCSQEFWPNGPITKGYRVYCHVCGLGTQKHETLEQAIAEWEGLVCHGDS